MTTFDVVTPDAALIQWIASHIDPKHGTAVFEPSTTRCTVLFDESGVPIVATAIDGWTDHSVDMTIASDGTKRWATAKFICGTYDYIFRFAGKNRVSMITAADNEAALRMQKALGHVREGVHRDYFGPGLDAVSFSYLKSDWLNGRWFARSSRTSK